MAGSPFTEKVMAKKEYHHAKHSKYLLHYHFVFCVKYRRKILNHKEVDDEIKRLFNEIAKKSGFTIDVMETDKDHIHVLVDAPPTLSPMSIAHRLKSQSTFHVWKTQDGILQWFKCNNVGDVSKLKINWTKEILKICGNYP